VPHVQCRFLTTATVHMIYPTRVRTCTSRVTNPSQYIKYAHQHTHSTLHSTLHTHHICTHAHTHARTIAPFFTPRPQPLFLTASTHTYYYTHTRARPYTSRPPFGQMRTENVCPLVLYIYIKIKFIYIHTHMSLSTNRCTLMCAPYSQ
jgi:hypothetical protein